jgi:hypothetical protein
MYFGLLLSLIRSDTRYLMFPIVAAGLSIVIYKFEKKQKTIIEKDLEKRDLDIVNNKVCTRVTVENPFMNPSIADLTFNPEKPGACDITHATVHKNIDDKFNATVFQDVNDIFNNKASQRQFYTLPSTTIPNNREGLLDWLYNRGSSCKQGNGDQCWRNRVNIGVEGRGHS